MYYGMIVLSALLFSLQFIFTDGYKKEAGSSWGAAVKFSFYAGIAGAVLALVISGFKIEFTLFSILVAIIYALVNVFYDYAAVRAFEHANLSVFSVFSMLGGMLLPFVFGTAFCNEKITVGKIVCCVLISLSLYIAVSKEKHPKGAVKYYIAVFILNGLVGVIAKFHQMHTDRCVDSSSFMLLTKLAVIAICLILMTAGKYRFGISLRAAACCTGSSVVNTGGNLILLAALLHLPASVQYPIVTGGVIVFSTVADIIRGTKLSAKTIASAAIAFAAICCVVL